MRALSFSCLIRSWAMVSSAPSSVPVASAERTMAITSGRLVAGCARRASAKFIPDAIEERSCEMRRAINPLTSSTRRRKPSSSGSPDRSSKARSWNRIVISRLGTLGCGRNDDQRRSVVLGLVSSGTYPSSINCWTAALGEAACSRPLTNWPCASSAL